ncbi:MAG: hypothetical protein RBR34_06480 [Rhodospirillaceae bacterium]|nr:hypothetical protein [Rhodospirillaceae bacterium]
MRIPILDNTAFTAISPLDAQPCFAYLRGRFACHRSALRFSFAMRLNSGDFACLIAGEGTVARGPDLLFKDCR